MGVTICHNCTERHSGCHSICERYILAKVEHEKVKQFTKAQKAKSVVREGDFYYGYSKAETRYRR